MPCDIYTLDIYLSFKNVLSDVSLSFTNHNVEYCIVGGDMNCASLNKFVLDESLY